MVTQPSKTVAVRNKAMAELREFAVLTAYFYVAFTALLFFKSAILQGQGVNWVPWGLAAIKAALIAKFVLIGQAMHVGERYRTRPLIWQTLYRSVVFLLLVVILDVVEEAIVGLIDGRTVGQSLAGLGGGTLDQLIATLVIVFLLFFPYFAFRSLAEVLGEGVLSRLFFVDRRSRSVTD
jgi:hypothetical protein